MSGYTLSSEQIVQQLRQIEHSKQIRILFACESGSRSWGFASPNSDYDIRFLYLRPVTEYLRLHPARDVIETPPDDLWDLSGWDLVKALKLLAKPNAALLEWLRAPIVYRSNPSLQQDLLSLAQQCVEPASLWHSYHGMAANNYREYLQGSQVQLKKYLYVLRPLLACRWITRYGDDPCRFFPPMAFSELTEALIVPNSPLEQEITELLARKKKGLEKEKGPRLPAIDAFLQEELETAQAPSIQGKTPNWDAFDSVFLHWLKKTSPLGTSASLFGCTKKE